LRPDWFRIARTAIWTLVFIILGYQVARWLGK
jgi:hypothetical protein